LELRNRRDAEQYARWLLGRNYLILGENSIPWILAHIDFFVSESSQGNERVKEIVLYPHAFIRNDDDVWDKLGQAIGNLQALEKLCIVNKCYDDNDKDSDDEDSPNPDWGILARI
jgi:hypothetical protein